MDVVCTAGHVDHGKSTLVRALTGMEPDRFAEEQRRGLTIDLGFAWASMTAGGRTRTVAFVDLPGHERFIANMLAGAGPLEVALFVVAADEGWKPQTAEHLEILDVLGVATGVVAITKIDGVDAARIAAVQAEIAKRLDGTSLEGARMVAVSARTGHGLDDLRDALLTAVEQRKTQTPLGLPRLWIDRAFSIKGAGTVVTGTLTGAPLRVGDEVLVRPNGPAGRIRGLQSLQQPVSAAQVGDRVAVNLAAIAKEDVGRGQVLTTRDAATTRADVVLRTLGDRVAGRRGAWHLHAGSGRWTVQLRPFEGPAIAGSGYATVTFDAPAPLQPGDRFVVRDAGSATTVGGGVVLDADPPATRGTRQREARLEALQRRHRAVEAGDRSELLALHVRERGVVAAAAAATGLGLPLNVANAAAKEQGLLPLGNGWADPAAVAGWSVAITTALQQYHRTHPLDRSAPRAVATGAAVAGGCPPAYTADLLTLLVRLQRVLSEGTGVRHPDHGVTLSAPDQQARDRLIAALEKQAFAPPRLSEAVQAAAASPALVRELETSGLLVRLGPDLAVTPTTVEKAHALLHRQFTASGPLTAAEAKVALGTSRKYALPLLEELDRRGITRRNGDVRDVTEPRPLPPTDR